MGSGTTKHNTAQCHQGSPNLPFSSIFIYLAVLGLSGMIFDLCWCVCRICSCGMRTLSCGMWDLVPRAEIEPESCIGSAES